MSTNTLLALGGNSPQAKVVEYYNSGLDEWIEILSLNIDKYLFRSVILDEKLMIVGGLPHDEMTAMVQSYDFSTGTLTTVKSMRIPRYNHMVAVLSRHLFAISGCTNTEQDYITNAVERYDTITDKWTDVAPIPTARYNSGTAVLDGEIYVIGGGNMQNIKFSTVESYNPITDSWKTCASMNEIRFAPAAAAIGKFIYVYGGIDNDFLNTGERYEPLIDRWTKIHSSSIFRDGCSGLNFNDSMMVAGGISRDGILNTVESYNVKDDQWTAKGSLTIPRVEFDLVNVPWEFIKQTQALKEPKDGNN